MIPVILFIILFMTGRIFLLGYERVSFKKAGEGQDSLVSTLLLFGIAGILSLPLLIFYPFPPMVLLMASISAIIYTFAFIIYVYVLSNYEISLVTPLYNFNVLFLLLLSIVFLDETFSWFKLAGIILLIYGVSFLDKKQNLGKSIIAIFKNRGCLLMSLMSLLLAIGRIFDTHFVRTGYNPAAYSIAEYTMISVYLSIIILFKHLIKHNVPSPIKIFKKRPKYFILGAFANGYSYIFLLAVLNFMDVSIAEPLSMLSVIVSILLSAWMFREKIKQRLVGAIIMFIGTVFLILAI